MSEDQLASSSFGDPNAQPPTPQQTPNSAVFPSPVFETPKNPQGSFNEQGGLTPRFAEDYSVFNSTPGNLRGTHGPFPDFVPATPATPASSSGHKRLLSAEGFAVEIAAHVNHFSPNPNLPLPPVDPSRRLPSSPDPLSANKGFSTDLGSPRSPQLSRVASSKKPRRGTIQDYDPSQIISPPPTARKGERKLAPKFNMQNDQSFGHPDFSDQQSQEMAALMGSTGDIFGFPMSAPVSGPSNNFWDPAASMNMDLDFGLAASNMFPADPSTHSHHRNTGSFDWNSEIQLFQDPNLQPPPSSNQENVQPVRRERILAPKPPTTMSSAAGIPVTSTYMTSMDDPFGIIHPGDVVDPGLLFSRPQTSAMESDFNAMAQSGSAEAAIADSSKALGGTEARRTGSAKEARNGKMPNRAFASSPIKPTGRPGLARSFSENRGRKALGRGALPTLAPAARPVPQTGSGSGVEASRSGTRPSGRVSPLKSQKRLSGLAPILEAPAIPRSRTSVRFTIDSHGRARAETTVMAAELGSDGGLVRSRSSRDLSGRGSWDSSDDDSSTDDEPIIIPSRNASFSASFALPDPRKPVGSIFHSSRRSISDRSTSTQANDPESEAETVMNEQQDKGGDAASELRKVVEDRQKRSTQVGSSRPQRLLTTDFGNFQGGTVSPTSLTDSSFGLDGHGMRCVCNKNGMTEEDGFMIQCESCEMWLHGKCINITRRTMPSVYICGFCANTPNMAGRRGREGGRGNALGISPLANKSFRSFR